MSFFILPFLVPFDRLLYRLLPDDPQETRLIPAVWYLKESALSTPVLALGYVKAEVARMGSIAAKMVRASLYPFLNSDPGHDAVFPKLSVIKGMDMREEKLDFLESRISDYLIKISRSALSDRVSKEVFALMNIVKGLESIGDVIETIEGKLLEKKRGVEGDLSRKGKDELMEIHKMACLEIEQLADALKEMDALKADALLQGNEIFKRMVAQAETAHLKRVFLIHEAELTHDMHMELINLFEQVHHYCKSVAQSIVNAVES